MDYDGDGLKDLLVSCPDRPYKGLYFFKNIGTPRHPRFAAAERISEKGMNNIRLSEADGKPYVLSKNFEYPDFFKAPYAKKRRLHYEGEELGATYNKSRSNMWSYADWDGDGDKDIVVGIDTWDDYGWDNAFDSLGRWTRGPLHGYVYLLENTGRGYVNRGKVEAAEAFELLEKDLEEAVKNGTSTTPFPEKYRVMFEGIPCWPKLPNLFKPLKEHGVNVTAVVYAPAFGFVYNNMDEMVRAYYKAPNSVCIEQGVDWREGICRDNKVDGVLVHYNRSCKPWSGYMAEMQRRFTKDLGVPCAGFDGDQADPRNFNEAQYETRVQGLVEAMEANQAAKEGAEK